MTSFNQAGDPGKEGDPATQEPQGATFGSKEGEGTDQSSDPTSQGGQPSGDVDVQKLAKRLEDSQAFIEQLKSETADYRSQIDDMKSKLESVPNIDQIKEQLEQHRGNQDPIDTDELIQKAVSQFDQHLSSKEKEKEAEQNFNQVAETLSKQFGEDVDSEVKRLAAENDMTFDEVVELSRRRPKAALKLLGIKEGVSGSGGRPSPSTTNTMAYHGQNPPTAAKQENLMQRRTERDRVSYMQQRMKEAGLG